MTEIRAGYDVTEAVWLEETNFGETPTAGDWMPFALATNFDPRPTKQTKEKIGLGRQLPSDFPIIKKWAEVTIEQELVDKEATPTPVYEWIEAFHKIITDSTFGATFSLSRRIPSLSIGAKLDLATDEFWWLKGCKMQRYEIGSRGVDQPLYGVATALAQIASYGTTDYVSGTATRRANPTSDYIKHADADIVISSSIYDYLNSWSLMVERTIQKRGRDATTPTLYKALLETKTNLELRVNVDFDSTSQLDKFIGHTKFDAVVKVPNATGGREITLSDGYWLEHSSPHRELDLISMDLTARFSNLSVATTA